MTLQRRGHTLSGCELELGPKGQNFPSWTVAAFLLFRAFLHSYKFFFSFNKFLGVYILISAFSFIASTVLWPVVGTGEKKGGRHKA